MVVREVKSIPYEQAVPWFLYKHYAKRVPGSVMYSFGLYENGDLIGVISYGMSSNSNLNEIGGRRILELNRLIINDGKKNAASYFIARTYKYLKDYILLSYADDNQGHHGYIYQACNWIYTGTTKGGQLLQTKNGIVHKRAYDQRKIKEEIITKFEGKKHRYFYVPDKNKIVIEEIKKRFPELPYPKGENIRYNSGKTLCTQQLLIY